MNILKIVIFYVIVFCNTVAEKEANVAVPVTAAKKEESNKREINRDGEKEERNKKLRKDESKENIPLAVEKKQVILFYFLN